MKNKKNYKRFSLILPMLLVALCVLAYVGYPNSSNSFSYQEVEYVCSEKIQGNKNISGFKPDDQVEFKKYCRAFYSEFPGNGGCDDLPGVGRVCEEYRAVLDILRREDVRKTIDRHSPSDAWVKALGHGYIKDKDYLKRILPAYSNIKIDCIIVVHSPEGNRFFIENADKHNSHDDHRYIEVPADEFLASLNNAPNDDVNNFWLALH